MVAERFLGINVQRGPLVATFSDDPLGGQLKVRLCCVGVHASVFPSPLT